MTDFATKCRSTLRHLGITDPTNDHVDLLGRELLSRGHIPGGYRGLQCRGEDDFECPCGQSPDPAESKWAGCFIEDGVLRYLCGPCWQVADAGKPEAITVPASGGVVTVDKLVE